ncbi:MAG: substrate-binding domain-containing protein [Acidimicrobiia bacterium]
MRSRISRAGLVAGAAALSLTLFSPTVAGAAPRPPAQSIANAGSDVAYFMMNLIDGHYQASSSNSDHDIITTIPPYNTPPFPASVTVPADSVHPAFTWNSSSAATTPPDGGSAGVAALENDATGQIDFARATSTPKPGETGTDNFWAYALGAVDYVTFPGTDAPASGLDTAQLQGIYTCNPATQQPYFTNWDQVGGKPGGIVRYAPPVGAGTLSFFQTKLLGGDTVDQNCNTSDLATRINQDDARLVSSETFQNAIFVFEWADWRSQKDGFSPNLTNGAVLGKFGINAITEKTPNTSDVNETANRYQGTRYIYNVDMKVNHPASDRQQLNDVNRLIGVRPADQGGPQYICSGKAKNDIIKAGYVPLPKFATGGIGLPQSFCRLDPTAL